MYVYIYIYIYTYIYIYIYIYTHTYTYKSAQQRREGEDDLGRLPGRAPLATREVGTLGSASTRRRASNSSVVN